MKPSGNGKAIIGRNNFDDRYTGRSSSHHAFSLKLPSGQEITFHPVSPVSSKYTHEALLSYGNEISLPQSDYRDVLPFQEPLKLPGLMDKCPVFTGNVKIKMEEMQNNSFEPIVVHVLLKDNQLYLHGDKHHTFVAALLCRQPVLLRKSPDIICRYTPSNASWKNIVWVNGMARTTGISKSDILKGYNGV